MRFISLEFCYKALKSSIGISCVQYEMQSGHLANKSMTYCSFRQLVCQYFL